MRARRARATAATEKLLRLVYPQARGIVHAGNAARRSVVEIVADLQAQLPDLIVRAAVDAAVPADCLAFEVSADRGMVDLRFLMPEFADQAHLHRVLAELAAVPSDHASMSIGMLPIAAVAPTSEPGEPR